MFVGLRINFEVLYVTLLLNVVQIHFYQIIHFPVE